MIRTVGIPELIIICLIVLILLGIAVAVIAVFAALRSRRPAAPLAPARETPLDILRARYARGEITAEQFAEMRRQLEGGGPPSP